MTAFGEYTRKKRIALNLEKPGHYSLRRVARESGITPSYLSLVENGKQAPPGEETTVRLARILGEDPDLLLSLGGKVATDLQQIIIARPTLFAGLLRALEHHPDEAILPLADDLRKGGR
ncbi:MAG: transcriptional regulator [Roseibacillus sp.]|nr:transcriptional regulator [Roseibacillus sp.]